MAFNFLGFLYQLAVGLVLNIIAYLLMPKPKGPKPNEVKDLEAPTAEAGRPIPVAFGDITISGVNVIFYAENESETFLIKV
jgi:predicted phage tail protein